MLEEPVPIRRSKVRTPSGMPVAVFMVQYAIEVEVQNEAALSFHDVIPRTLFDRGGVKLAELFRSIRIDFMLEI